MEDSMSRSPDPAKRARIFGKIIALALLIICLAYGFQLLKIASKMDSNLLIL